MERVNQKKEELLDEYIREKKWKLAFKLVESRQKKGDKSDALLIRKIIILLCFQDDSRIEQGKKELIALQLKKPPITDQQALKRLDLFLAGRKDRDDFANNLWAAAGAISQEEEFLSTWFQLKFNQGRWEAAQKAAQIWQKAFPKQRAPFFLWILSSHLVSIAPGVSDMSRKVAQGFAYKLLAKAAAEVPLRKNAGEGVLSPPRAIKTEQDLLLLIEVCTAQLKYLEALAVLEDSRTGYLSHLSQNKWDVARHMIGLYELSENWKSQWNICSAILVNARPEIFDKMTDDSSKFDFGDLGDDWRVWDGLVTACGKLASSSDAKSYADRTETIIDQFCKEDKSRNAVLANVKLHFVKTEVDANCQSLLVSICKDFFSRFCTKVTCFQDLRPYVSKLDVKGQTELLQSMKSCALSRLPAADADAAARLYWITAEANVMKFEYHFVISRDENNHLDSLLPKFVCNCIRLYKTALQYDFKLPPSDRLPGDDAAILAAMALVHMYRFRHQNHSWAYSHLRCVALLRFAKDKSPKNYDILLILIRIYMYLGAGSLALVLWTELSIKNLQHLTVSWMLFTRLSTLHPYTVTVSEIDGNVITIDPLKEAVDAMNWHQRAGLLNSHSMEDFRANGQWMMELDALEAKSALQDGYSKLMLLGESSRMRRLRPPGPQTEVFVQTVRLPAKTTDTRDSTAFPNYEAPGQMPFWRICPSVEFAEADITNERWLASNLRQALIWDHLDGNTNTIVERDDLEIFSQSYDEQVDATSDVEKILFNIGILIQKSLDQLGPQAAKGGLLADSIGQILLQINALNDEGSLHTFSPKADDSSRTHFGTDLHTKYCLLETCQFVSKLVTVVEKAGRTEFWIKKVLADLQAGSKDLAANVYNLAIDLRAELEKEAFTSHLCQKCGGGENDDDDEIGNALNELLIVDDPQFLDKYVKTLQGSWMDAYDGVIKTTKVID